MSDNSVLPISDLTTFIFFPPNTPEPFKSDGSLNWANWPSGNNPYSSIENTLNAKTTNLVTNLKLSYTLFKGLELRSSFGYTNMQLDEVSKFPILAKNPASSINTGNASFSNNNIKTWIVEPQVQYNIKFGNSIVDALAGMTLQNNENIGNIIDVSGYTSDALLDNIQGGQIVQ